MMTATLEKTRTASIIVALENDAFTIKQMLFTGDKLMETVNWPAKPSEDYDIAEKATHRIHRAIDTYSNRPTSVFITISAAKRMTDDMIAGIQAAALGTRT